MSDENLIMRGIRNNPTWAIEVLRQLIIGVTVWGLAALTETQEVWLLSFCSLILTGINHNIVTPNFRAEIKADAAHAQGVKDGIAQAETGIGV